MIKTEENKIITENTKTVKNIFKKGRVLILNFNPPDALILEFRKQKIQYIHNFLVPYPLHILYLDKNNKITNKHRLTPWRGISKGKAQKIIEIPEIQNNKETIHKINLLQKGDKIKIK